jgi:hypothetical protein
LAEDQYDLNWVEEQFSEALEKKIFGELTFRIKAGRIVEVEKKETRRPGRKDDKEKKKLEFPGK